MESITHGDLADLESNLLWLEHNTRAPWPSSARAREAWRNMWRAYIRIAQAAQVLLVPSNQMELFA